MGKHINILQCGALSDNKGGIESYIRSQVEVINKNIFKIDFLISKKQKYIAYENEIKSNNCIIYKDLVPWNESFFGHYISLYKFFKKHKNKYDIVVSNILDFHNINILIMAKFFGVKICIPHAHMAYDLRRNIIYKYLGYMNRFLSRFFCDYVFACSKSAGEWVYGKNLWNEKGIVINNAIDVDKYIFKEDIRILVRNKLDLKNKLVIGHTGKFLDQKNHEFIIDIFEKVHEKNHDSILILVGQGPLENNIRQKVKNKNLIDSVMFLGMRNDVNELLQGMDIFLFPSKYEGLPVSLVEAQAAGLKCIVSDEVISKEIAITNLVEFISLNKDAEYWSNEILKNYPYNRKNTRKEIIKAGYSVKESVKNIEEFYLNLFK